ncbi:unnamed protein product, partial [Symbiodinium pilosum]
MGYSSAGFAAQNAACSSQYGALAYARMAAEEFLGAIRSNRIWPTRRAKSLAAATLGLTCCEIEQQELVRWRREVVVVLQSAKLPMCEQNRLASHPDAAIAAAIGAARATTIRSRVHEWKRAERHFHAITAHTGPTRVGVLLDYFHECRLEPCARSVPSAILKSSSFMEKAGGVPEQDRFSVMPVVRNTVNQFTMELEMGAPPTRKAPLLPVATVCSLELA